MRILNEKGTIMKGSFCLFTAFLIWTLCSSLVHGDTWALPVEKDYFSDNNDIVAHVTPAKGEIKARLEVFEIKDSNRVSIWKCALGNEGAPMYVFVSDDGAYVVTVNEVSGRVSGGMGDYVLAFYNKDGVIKHYSLEQLLHYPEKIDKNEYRRIAHRTSSGRHWAGRPMFFDKPDGKLHFCIWLVYGHRWLVWELSSGREVKIDDKMAARLNEKGRKWAREEGIKSRYRKFALKFLGQYKRAIKPVSIEDSEIDSGKYERWIKALVERYPVALGKDEDIFSWWPLEDGLEYRYKITGSRRDVGKKWIDKEFTLKLVKDKEGEGKFRFEVEGFSEFVYEGLLVRGNRVFVLQGNAEDPLIVFPLFEDMLFSTEAYEHEFLKKTVLGTSEESFYAPVWTDFWRVHHVVGNRYGLKQFQAGAGLWYEFEKGVGIVEWFMPRGYTIELLESKPAH